MIKKLFVLIASVLFTISAFAQTPVVGPVGLSGVVSINSSTGNFTFTGSGVSCTGTTCTFTGGSVSFTALSGDAHSTSTGGATTVTGLNGTQLSALASGILYNTTATGVPSIATAAQIIAGFGTQTANTIFAGPASGSAAAPTFRALVSADIPNNAANTSGTAGNLSGTPALPNGTTATTQSQANGSTKLATTAYVDTGLATKGAGMVTAVSIASANGVSGTSSGGATPALTIVLGAITPSSVASTGAVSGSSFQGTGTTPNSLYLSAGTGNIPALAANSAGFAAPVTGGTSFLYKLPATAVAGILHAASPATFDNVTESALTSSAVSLSADVTGQLPISAVGSAGLSGSGGVGIASTGVISLSGIPGSAMTNHTVTATQLATQYSNGLCTELWRGSGTSFALTTGDDAMSNNSCYNDSGVTRTITAVKCRSNIASNTTTVNPTFGSAGTGTTILSGALTCGSSLAYSSTGTVSNASWTTGTGITPAMSGTLTGTSIAMIVEYTY